MQKYSTSLYKPVNASFGTEYARKLFYQNLICYYDVEINGATKGLCTMTTKSQKLKRDFVPCEYNQIDTDSVEIIDVEPAWKTKSINKRNLQHNPALFQEICEDIQDMFNLNSRGEYVYGPYIDANYPSFLCFSSNSKFCCLEKKFHVHNHVSFIVNLVQKTVFRKCRDPICLEKLKSILEYKKSGLETTVLTDYEKAYNVVKRQLDLNLFKRIDNFISSINETAVIQNNDVCNKKRKLK